MRFEMRGLGDLQRHLTEAQRAFEALDGEITTVKIDGSDPASIETAIAQMQQAVNERIESYRGNALVSKVGADLKERYAAAIRRRGEAAIADFLDQSAPTQDTDIMVNPTSGNEPATDKDAQRYLVLNYFYQFNEQHCAEEQWSEHAAIDLKQQGHFVAHADVARAIMYLSDKGLLRITKRQGYISGEETVLRAGITARGIDAVERPTDFSGVLSPQVINYFVRGSMNLAHGDQQIVGHDNTGVLAQGQAQVKQRTEMPPFPAERLRSDFANHPDAIAAVDALENELHTETPRASVVAAALETIKNVATVAEISKTFTGWFTDPAIQHQLSSIAARAFGS